MAVGKMDVSTIASQNEEMASKRPILFCNGLKNK
jgi:hypothetical protein